MIVPTNVTHTHTHTHITVHIFITYVIYILLFHFFMYIYVIIVGINMEIKLALSQLCYHLTFPRERCHYDKFWRASIIFTHLYLTRYIDWCDVRHRWNKQIFWYHSVVINLNVPLSGVLDCIVLLIQVNYLLVPTDRIHKRIRTTVSVCPCECLCVHACVRARVQFIVIATSHM